MGLSQCGPVFWWGADVKETSAAFAERRDLPSGGGSDTAGSNEIPAAGMAGILASLWECPKTVVARIRGPAPGGGPGPIAPPRIPLCTTTATLAFSQGRLRLLPA